MSKNRKYFPHNSVVLITTRAEEGLPLTPTYLNNLLIWGILARAANLYQLKLCHLAGSARLTGSV